MPRNRKQATKRVKPRIFIFCEGAKTEPEYLRAYINTFHPTCARLKNAERPVQIEKTLKNTPKELVEVAIKFARNLEFKGDCVWVMYDREAEARYSDALHQQAWLRAEKQGIRVAISNVCFEFWLLLHFRYSNICTANCDGVINSKIFKDAFKSIGSSDYQKGGQDIFKALMTAEYIANAKRNAQRVNEQTKLSAPTENASLPYLLNPYTNVYEILDAIDRVAE